MEWSDSLDTGVDAMNHEHQGLLDIMNNLYDLAQAGKTGPQITVLVQKLAKATTDHFAHEEAYMQSINYPGYTSHKAIHTTLLDRLAKEADTIMNNSGVVSDDFFTFLKFWLTSHIQGIDKKYGEYSAKAVA